MASVITPGGHERVPRRLLQHNVHASLIFKKHEISWSGDKHGNEDMDASERAWVQAIRGGDSIRVIPRAQWPGWINYVRGAEIEAYCSRDTITQLPSIPQCYRHLDRSRQEIRLLRLDPAKEGDPISVELWYATLPKEHKRGDVDASISYEALSYCWGDPRNRREIMVTTIAGPDHGIRFKHVFSVTESLFSALVRIRPPPGQPARTVWVDAICINQNDLDERSHQVAMMQQIYRQAIRVIIWLGDGDEGTHKSIQRINAMADRFAALNESSLLKSIDIAAIHDSLGQRENEYSFIDNWTLFESPWFRRTWVVQEIFNSQKAIFCCGSDTTHWSSLLRVNKCILQFGLSAKTAARALMPPIFEKLVGSTETAMAVVRSSNMSILDVLLQGLDLDATDPRDKIFAMLQFGKETQDFSLLPPSLRPDYQRPVREVFAFFTKWYIVESRSLRILSAIQALEGRTWQRTSWGLPPPPRASDLPSWSWGYRGYSNWVTGLLGISPNCPYQAAESTEPDTAIIRQHSLPSELALAGFSIDRIASIVPYPYLTKRAHHAANVDRISDDYDLHSAFVALFDPLNLTGKWIQQLGSKNNATYALATAEDPAEAALHGAAHRNFASRTGGALECLSNCFFHTNSGHQGLCPSGAQTGDLLVVLLGGHVPYVLREKKGAGEAVSGRWEFIGECYLQGYMYGRAVKERNKEGVDRFETFILV